MKHIVSRMSSYFPNRWPLSYLNLTKNMKTYIRRQQHKKFIHQDIKQKEPPQKYRLGTISNTKLLAGLNRFYMDFCLCENKGADQLRSDCEADQRLCFFTRIVHFLFLLNPKFQASMLLRGLVMLGCCLHFTGLLPKMRMSSHPTSA